MLNWVPQQQNVPNSLNWVFDSASGILQFYQNDATLNGLNINKTGLDASGNPIEGKRPRISFIKYVGPKGAEVVVVAEAVLVMLLIIN